mgnify:CR=1 FL=1
MPTEYVGRIKKMFDLIRTFFLIKKKAVKSGTISSSEKYGYRINYL